MESQKLYLEPKLTLGTLAEQLKVSVNHLSQVINQYEGVNFHDFVNRYRVDEFKSRIANPKYKGFSLLAIAFDSGFNSKSSFNQIFKKSTGLTPSQYLERSAKV
jgi:AraC-like DNA-binding protein